MIQQISIHKILFIDIETVPLIENYHNLSEKMQILWGKKTQYIRGNTKSSEEYYNEKAGVYSEFSKIVCISCGIVTSANLLRIKSYFDHNEHNVLKQFANMLKVYDKRYLMCAHNGKEFDFPFLARRMIINKIKIPQILQLAGKKPWQIPHIDTMELWKFGDRKNFTSIALLCEILDIPTPKEEMDGSQVAKVYFGTQNLDKIVQYCENDVLALVNIFQRFRDDIPIELENQIKS